MIYEVFLKKDGKDEYRHAGALDAADDELAMVMARDTYVRRSEGNRIWLVRRDHVIAGTAGDLGADVDRPHRHHDGMAVAARRKEQRETAS
ncbi:MAG: 1,2-phenylacetyl-CoA epoxidase subunit B [Ilumatobacter sp.]